MIKIWVCVHREKQNGDIPFILRRVFSLFPFVRFVFLVLFSRGSQHWGYKLTEADLQAHAVKKAKKG